jgi:hypothetical protein
MTPEQLAAIERLRELAKNAYWTQYCMALENEALPLIEALAAENERLRVERDALQAELDEKSSKELDFVADCEFEILRIARKFETDLKAVQAERNALRARIDGALRYLDYSKVNSAIAREVIEILKGESRG